MADIGAQAGIVGSGIYRHFSCKDAILVALLDRVLVRLRHGASAILAGAGSGQVQMTSLIRDHIAVALTDRTTLALYHREIHTVPDDERRRLRRLQRHYLETWVRVLAPLRPDLTTDELRVLVHGAVGTIQSTSLVRTGLSDDRLTVLLDGTAHACLGIPPAHEGPYAAPLDVRHASGT